MLPIGTLFRDLLFFQGYVGDPELLRSLGESAGAPAPTAAGPVLAREAAPPAVADGLAADSG